MSLLSILKDIGSGIVSTLFPQAAVIISSVRAVSNAFDEKEDKDITGVELAEVIECMDSADQLAVIESYNAVLIKESDDFVRVQALLKEVTVPEPSRRGDQAYLLTCFSCFWITAAFGIIGFISVAHKIQPDAWLIGTLLTFPFTIIGATAGIKSSEIKKIADLKSPYTGTIKTVGAGILTNLVKKVF